MAAVGRRWRDGELDGLLAMAGVMYALRAGGDPLSYSWVMRRLFAFPRVVDAGAPWR